MTKYKNIIQVKVTPEQAKIIGDFSDSLGIPKTTFLRMITLDFLKSQLIKEKLVDQKIINALGGKE